MSVNLIDAAIVARKRHMLPVGGPEHKQSIELRTEKITMPENSHTLA